MYIQEDPVEKERAAPPDYSGHTYTAPPTPHNGEPSALAGEQEVVPPPEGDAREQTPKSAPTGAFFGSGHGTAEAKGGKRGDFLGSLGLGNLLSRIPFLSSLAPPSRGCENGTRKHSELWDLVLLAVIALSLLKGKDDDILPLLLLLLLWD